MAPRLDLARVGHLPRPRWTKHDDRRLASATPSGVAVEVERGELGDLLTRLLGDEVARAELPLTTPFEPYMWAEGESDWPGRIYRVSGTDIHWVARAAEVRAADEVADLLNRAEGPRLADRGLSVYGF
jgi:hypothetical protein